MKKIQSLLFFLCISLPAIAQLPQEGSWRGAILYEGDTVPFTFEIAYPNGEMRPVVTFINGEDSSSIEANIHNDQLIMPMFAFDITLEAKTDMSRMKGTLIKHYSGKRYEFEAKYGRPRYQIKDEKDPLQIEERWTMKFRHNKDNAYPAVGLFEQKGNKVTATFLTEVSDFRFFEGKLEGNRMELSSFDGAHAFLFKGSYEEGTWSGKMVFDNGYEEQWIGSYDDEAEIRDPWEVITLGKGEEKPLFEDLVAEGQVPISASEYEDKVLIIQIFGTWCPNSWDQSKYLVDWYSKNQDREVDILALNFETNYSTEYGEQRIKTYKEQMGMNYKVALGGRLSKKTAADAFPFMDSILAFPTLVIVDKEGYARYVHSFFTGPATGKYYDEFDTRFNAIVDKLEAE